MGLIESFEESRFTNKVDGNMKFVFNRESRRWNEGNEYLKDEVGINNSVWIDRSNGSVE